MPEQKTILITGSTHGIGEAAAKALAAQGHQVILHGRSEPRCQEVAAEIEHLTGRSNTPYLIADLSEVRQVRDLASLVKANFDRLDVLVNNAGNFFLTRQLTPDGFEMTWAVNHLSYFVLTLDLLDLLKASPPARIVNVSSNSHFNARLDCDPLTGLDKRTYLSWKAYARSKLANVLFTYELARRLHDQGVTANALHPGLVRTHIWDKFGIFYRLVKPFWLRRSLSVEEGAQTTIYLATSPEVEGVSGKYFHRCQAVDSSRESYRVGAARRLWEAGNLLVKSA
jgi:NAD(P)-dependent dehydrogenase (short-subunit alcohol dehydrogenase family)